MQIIQHVDVCMFSNGKFKNTVAEVTSKEGCPVDPGYSYSTSYVLRPEKSSTKNWIALEDNFSTPGATLASSVLCSGSEPEDRNVFAIYVSYYVKVCNCIITVRNAFQFSNRSEPEKIKLNQKLLRDVRSFSEFPLIRLFTALHNPQTLKLETSTIAKIFMTL